MTFKKGVDRRRVHPRLWQVLSWTDQLHFLMTGREAVITSLRRTSGSPKSKHRHKEVNLPLYATPPELYNGVDTSHRYYVMAADIRRWYLDERGKSEEFAKLLQKKLGSQLGVVLEPEWLSPSEVSRRGGIQKIAPHIHIQLKSPIRWTMLPILAGETE